MTIGEHKAVSEFHPIGEPFSFDGTTLIASENTKEGCSTCYCNGEDRKELCQKLQCTSGIRADGKSVIFDEMFPQ